jgi:hypothetical protein
MSGTILKCVPNHRVEHFLRDATDALKKWSARRFFFPLVTRQDNFLLSSTRVLIMAHAFFILRVMAKTLEQPIRFRLAVSFLVGWQARRRMWVDFLLMPALILFGFAKSFALISVLRDRMRVPL